ncbi:MAG: tripartite tricarboxylate transporter substrate binding protein [Rhodoplanes sp.]|uniref:Bug family tripartite tricarboxylate transporter substrate binding protein n=1 Tax=Rhodoplanes sp. TaxID=1968906 RepID=UPI0017B75ED6|nr:tripartite tricarboxylate transporter substrate binding protein [Rhodoplanes sp.]NVO16271.1 tripartite tricarboxylate transporter substrate binding protein [Rhodoplanes sp.]
MVVPFGTARATDWLPGRPIRLIVPYVAGGATDIAGRILAEAIAEPLKQPMVVENRGGAAGNIGGAYVANADPNGLTLLLGAVGLLTTNPFLYKNMGFSPAKDLTPISMVYTSDLVLVVRASHPAKTVQEFVALAKAKPGSMNFGSSGNGASTHTAMELFKLVAGIDVQHVPYRGSAAAFADLLGGHLQVIMVQVPTVVASIQSGDLRALVVTGERRNPALPDVPTMAEAGYKGADAMAWGGLLAPARTPRDIVQTISAATVLSLGKPDVKTRIANTGLDAVSSTPEAMAAYMDEETRKWERVVREAHITAD